MKTLQTQTRQSSCHSVGATAMTDRDKLTNILPVPINIVAWFVRSLQKPLHWRSQRYVAITDSN